MKPRYLSVEQPESDALVDFLSEGISVELIVKDGVLRVVARVAHGEEASTWDPHEVEWPLKRGA